MLKDKRIVVTGAGRGIGRAIAEACAREGAIVGVNYHKSEDEARALRDKDPDRYRLLPFDVSDAEAVSEAVTRFREEEGRIDGWVNNAGINLPDLLAVAEPERMRAQVEVNLLGPLYCARAVLPVMLEQRGGVIVNIGSVAAARPFRGQAAYAASKGGLESLTRAIAVEYGRKGVRAHCVRVGPTETRMFEATKALAGDQVRAQIPLRRFGRPEDAAEMVVYLLSESSGFVTGAVHTIDGGFLAG